MIVLIFGCIAAVFVIVSVATRPRRKKAVTEIVNVTFPMQRSRLKYAHDYPAMTENDDLAKIKSLNRNNGSS